MTVTRPPADQTGPAPATTLLGPDRVRAGVWALVGLAACGLAVWVVGDSAGHGLAWALLVASAVLTAPYAAQLLVPGRFTWRLEADALVVRTVLRELRVPWDTVHLARVVRQAGEPALELQVDTEEGRHTRLVLLPVGADRGRLHAGLEQHLGAGSPADPTEPGPGAGGPGHGAGTTGEGQ